MRGAMDMAEDKVQSKGVVTVIMAAAFLFTFSQFLLITAFPTIMAEFGINATQVQWLTTSFLLTSIIFIPMSGYLSTTFSSKALVVFAMSCMLIGTIIGGWSPNFGILILSRVIQAIGAGIILPLVQTILLIVFPYHRRGFAMGMLECRARFGAIDFRYRHRYTRLAFTALGAAASGRHYFDTRNLPDEKCIEEK